MADYTMSCLACGQRLNDDGTCPNCGASPRPAPPAGVEASRDHAHVARPPGGAVVTGRADRLGVFQARGQRTNWFVRVAALIAAALFGVVALVIVVAGIVGLVTGAWLLPHGGWATVAGITVLLVSLLVVTGIGVMLWLLARGDRDSPPRRGVWDR
jgi:hypothetical protein